MSLNLLIVVLYLINLWSRLGRADDPGSLVWLSLVAILLLLVSGWLGGRMVYEQGVAVTPGHD